MAHCAIRNANASKVIRFFIICSPRWTHPTTLVPGVNQGYPILYGRNRSVRVSVSERNPLLRLRVDISIGSDQTNPGEPRPFCAHWFATASRGTSGRLDDGEIVVHRAGFTEEPGVQA